MTGALPEHRTRISGVGISRIGRRTGIAGLELTAEAVRSALADACIDAADVDAVATMGDTRPAELASALGMGAPLVLSGAGEGGLLEAVMQAADAIAAGQARRVLVYRTVAMQGGSVAPGPGAGPSAAPPRRGVMSDVGLLLAYHGYSAANWLAMHCQRYLHEHGATKEQLGWLAIASREHAGRNPLAVMRDPLTMDDYLAARPISTPFGLLDCDVPVDGSIALLLVHADLAADTDAAPIRIEAMGRAPYVGGWVDRADYPLMAAEEAARAMWARTALRPSDVDVAELYDGFTYLTFAWLEALGLVGRGEAGPFVEGGRRIGLDGTLPLNTYGGQLSAGRMHGYWVLHEACLQLRGAAGSRQVPSAPEVAVVSAGGGPIAGCLLLTRDRDWHG